MLRSLPFLWISLLIAGCCRVPRPTTGPSSSEDLVEVVRAHAAELPTLRGELRVDHMGPEGRVAGKVYAFASAGGRLRLEAVSPMETPLRTVAVDGSPGRFTMTDQEEQRCIEGEAAPCLVGEAIGIELSAAHVAATLAGAVPLLRHGRATSSWHRCGYYEVTLDGQQEGWTETLRLALHDGHLVVTRATVSGPEGPVLEIEHRDHSRQGTLLMPERSIIRTPRTGGDLRVIWRSVEVGVDLPDRAWRATCPEGFAIEMASCESTGSQPLLEEPGPPPGPAEPPDGGGADGGVDGGGEGDGGTDEPDLGQELGLN